MEQQTLLAVAHIMVVAKSFSIDSEPMEGFVAPQVKKLSLLPPKWMSAVCNRWAMLLNRSINRAGASVSTKFATAKATAKPSTSNTTFVVTAAMLTS